VHLLPLIDEQLQEMQKQGIICPAQSEWGSNLVVVKKKDSSHRFCVDYHQLYERTIKDTYPLRRIDDCLDILGGLTWFSTMDLGRGYHQVALDGSNADKTTFIMHRGTFAFNVILFVLCNAPATFQRLMDCKMAGLNQRDPEKNRQSGSHRKIFLLRALVGTMRLLEQCRVLMAQLHGHAVMRGDPSTIWTKLSGP